MTTHVTFMHTLGLKWVYIAIMPWIMALLCSLLHKECVHSRLLLSFFKVTWWSKISCNVDFQITCLIASEHKGEKGQGPRAPTLFCRTCCSMNLASWQGTFLWISRRALEEKAQLFFCGIMIQRGRVIGQDAGVSACSRIYTNNTSSIQTWAPHMLFLLIMFLSGVTTETEMKSRALNRHHCLWKTYQNIFILYYKSISPATY